MKPTSINNLKNEKNWNANTITTVTFKQMKNKWKKLSGVTKQLGNFLPLQQWHKCL